MSEGLENDIYKARQKLKWLTGGWFIHCIPTYMWSDLTAERICELYNVDMDYFTKPKEDEKVKQNS